MPASGTRTPQDVPPRIRRKNLNVDQDELDRLVELPGFRAIWRGLARPFRRTARITTPSAAAWRTAGEAVAQLAWDEGLDRRTVPRSFINDALIAANCREEGLTIVTENRRDFERLQRLIDFEFLPPWPA